ncbi:hypothetical protein [Shewanella psychrophila]|nr:hypothetical protein [Shewanella psychrophila]
MDTAFTIAHAAIEPQGLAIAKSVVPGSDIGALLATSAIIANEVILFSDK